MSLLLFRSSHPLEHVAGPGEHCGEVGDVADDVRVRADISITPVKGGVGPLTVAALIDNVITAARRKAND